MKARVIKGWEMSGITHKVGEIMAIPLHSPGGLPMTSDIDAFLLDNGFIEEIKEKTRWKPERDQKYYWVGSDGYVYSDLWGGWESVISNDRFEFGDCFETGEEAERVAEYLKALAVVRGDATSKFDKKSLSNWYVSYDSTYNYLYVNNDFENIRNGVFGLPYFATSDDAQRSIELHKKEWRSIFGVKEEE